ncbi:hypothetical protein JXA32_03415 [Candidatus Sumerlaeota bacterium]|nr:hypothetical protein [Candidatus Sumerlaeota bacterium]
MNPNEHTPEADAEEIRGLQRLCEERIAERRELAAKQFRRAEEFLWSLHTPEQINRLVGDMQRQGYAEGARRSSCATRWLPQRLYCWLARKVAGPFAAPYVQGALLNYNYVLRETALDLYAVLDLRYGRPEELLKADEGKSPAKDDELRALRRLLDACQARLDQLDSSGKLNSDDGEGGVQS